MSFQPTAEQTDALAKFATGRSLVIEAGAGTGKTSTLKLLAESTNRRGQYLAFNRAIVEESKAKMPGTVRCNTAHSAAFRVMVRRINMDRLRSPRMKSWDIAAQLGINSGIQITTQEGDRKQLSATYLAGLTMKAITKFCQSADDEPGAFHVPYIKGIDFPPGSYANNREVAKTLVPYMRKAWADLMRNDGNLPFQHDHYLKAWQLDDPRIDTDYILFDEAQDANPVMVAIVAAQAERAQLVWVGDSQQQIYTFTGAVNAMQTVGAEQTTFLTQSFRFGPAIAGVANSVLSQIEGAQLRLVGTESIASTVGAVAEPHAILTRTNAEAVRNVLQAQAAGKRPHLVGGGAEIVSFAKAAQALMDGRSTEHADLACFDTWGEVLEYVEQDEQGGDLRLLVKLITEFSVPTILAALDNMVTEQAADVIVSTAHKSKGREWDTVQLGADYPDQMEGEELRLLYVSVTRAKMRLDHEAVAFLSKPPLDKYEAMRADPALVELVDTLKAPVSPQATNVKVIDPPDDDATLAANLVKTEICKTEEEAYALIESTHADPHHDFASCPRCIQRGREAEHEAEGQCGAPPPEPGDDALRAPRTFVAARPGQTEPDDGEESYEVYSGRSGAVRVPALVAVAHARDLHRRTGRKVTVLDASGELVVEFDR